MSGNLGVLYKYELKKIVKRKITAVSVVLMLAVIVLTIIVPLLGTDSSSGLSRYREFQLDKSYQQALSGRYIDDELLGETIAAYRQVPLNEKGRIDTSSVQYQTFARPYSAVFGYIYRAGNMESIAQVQNWHADEQDLRQRRTVMLAEYWDSYALSAGERAYWQAKDAQISQPVQFFYQDGYILLLDAVCTIGFMTILFVIVCLCGVFNDEHVRKTDQLNLAAKLGRKTLYRAKILAGSSFAAAMAAFFALTAGAIALCVYGAEGFNSAFSLFKADYSYDLSIGQAVLIAYGAMIVVAVLVGVFTMLLSEALGSNVGAMAVVMIMVLIPMFFQVPEEYRLLDQLYSYIPSNFLNVWNIFNPWLIKIGRYFTSWQVMPIIYLLLSLLLAKLGRKLYDRYQVTGR